MPHIPFAAILVSAALLSTGETCDGGELTTEQLHAISPLARAMNARVGPPAPGVTYPTAPGSVAPAPIVPSPSGAAAAAAAESSGPTWLKMLTPRSASAQVTDVIGDDLSTTEFALRSSHGLRGVPPFVTLSPAVKLLSVDGPTTEAFPSPGPDLPARLWEFSAGLRAIMPISDQWTLQGGLSPGFYSDLDNTSGDAIRVQALGLGIYQYSERTQFTVGFVYLDREDVSWLPALGMIHKPTDRTTLELTMPRPRAVHQLWGYGPKDGGFGYLAGELGGGSWAVERNLANAGDRRFDDIATISDLRLLAGLEVKNEGDVGLLAETGWVFRREIEYESGIGDVDLDDAWLFRVGLRR